MKKIISMLLIFSAFIITSCKKKIEIKENKPLINDTLKINFKKNYSTLFPPMILDATSSNIVNQIYDGLVKYNPKNLKIEPAIAKSWHKKNDTVYIFNIRNDVYFGKYKELNFEGEKLTMEDIMFTFQYLCTNTKYNKNFYSTMWKILGAKEYYLTHQSISKNFNIKGIKALNDTTLQITITDKNFPLLKILANPTTSIFSKKAYKKLKEKCYVGAGPYQIANVKNIKYSTGINDDLPKLMLKYNPYYYIKDKKGNTLPYFSYISISFIKYEKKELDLLSEGLLDIVFNVKNDNVIYFLDKNIKYVNTKNPKFILNKPCSEIEDFVNIYNSSILNFYSNNLFYLDFSIVKK